MWTALARAEALCHGGVLLVFDGARNLRGYLLPNRLRRRAHWVVFKGYGNRGKRDLFIGHQNAADYEIDQKEENGWRLLQLYNRPSPDSPSSTKVSQTTYRFNGSIYVSVRSQKIKRRTFSISPN